MPLDPMIQNMLAATKASGWPGIAAVTPQEARDFMAARNALLGQGPEVGAVEEVAIATRGGAIPGRLFLPSAKPKGLIVFYHGGGWVFGTPDEYELIARCLVDRTGCATLLVDYRLAPEHRFPAGVEDCYDAFLWAAEQRHRLGGASLPLIVAGDSAGGNLAAVCAALARDAGGPAIAYQVLVYPVADCDFTTASYKEHGEGLMLTGADMKWFFAHYVGDETRYADPLVSPMRAPSLAGLPPAFVVTAEYDVLRDEGEAFAAKLRDAGVVITLRRYDGMAHGFLRMVNLIVTSRQAMDDIGRAISARCS
ncbi:MAG: esterase [Rhodospirillales bacterium]|nr:esterase [Rhodospirillales bacterium]